MAFIGRLKCPKCAGEFRVGIAARRRPTDQDVFEVVCPHNASRFRFRGAGGPHDARPVAFVEDLEEVGALPWGTVIAALVRNSGGRA